MSFWSIVFAKSNSHSSCLYLAVPVRGAFLAERRSKSRGRERLVNGLEVDVTAKCEVSNSVFIWVDKDLRTHKIRAALGGMAPG